MCSNPIEIWVHRGDQIFHALLKVNARLEVDPVQLAERFMNGVGRRLAAYDGNQPLVLGDGVIDLIRARARRRRIRADHEHECLGSSDGLPDLGHPLFGGQDAFPVDPRIPSALVQRPKHLTNDVAILARVADERSRGELALTRVGGLSSRNGCT
jgi:hypothetical protein